MTVRDVRFDAQLLTDLRQYRLHYHRDRYVLTADELDALLAVADERDALRRAACEMPDEVAPPPEARARLLEAIACRCGIVPMPHTHPAADEVAIAIEAEVPSSMRSSLEGDA